jgi:RNA polymerase sigma-32 factor
VANSLKRKKKVEVSSNSASVSQEPEAPEVEVVEADEVIVEPDDVSVEDVDSNSAQSTHSTVIDLGELFGDAPDDDDGDGDSLPAISKSERSGLVPYSPLEAYLSEIRRFKPLTREEEQIVAEEYVQTKSRASAYKLVSSNLWLVVKLAREYERVARNVLDLIQEGNIGLMEAVRNFDPHRGVRFPSYAVWWIRAYMIRFIIANWRLVKIGTTQAQRKLFFNLKKESERLERQGIYPSPKLLAEKLNVREGDVVEMAQRLSAPDMSVDAPLQDDSEGSLLSIIPSGEDNAEDVLARKQLHKLLFDTVHEFESRLTEKEKMIFQGRVLDEDKSTLQEISDKLSISKERVRQIENKLKERLRVLLSERMGTELDGVIESEEGGSDE